ncbi:MAG: hypothetical protein WKH64_16310 [Chloroflexia bacterium]
MTIAGYEGDLQAKTGNGRVRIERLSGRAVLTTGNGRIEVLDVGICRRPRAPRPAIHGSAARWS